MSAGQVFIVAAGRQRRVTVHIARSDAAPGGSTWCGSRLPRYVEFNEYPIGGTSCRRCFNAWQLDRQRQQVEDDDGKEKG